MMIGCVNGCPPGATTAATHADSALPSAPRFGTDEFAAWRHTESLLIPQRLKIRQVARALLVHPRHIPQAVVAALAADA